MPESLSVRNFLKSEAAQSIREELIKMVNDPAFNTNSTYSPTSEGSSMLFVDKHLNYLSKHLNLDPQQYLSNLRLKARLTSGIRR